MNDTALIAIAITLAIIFLMVLVYIIYILILIKKTKYQIKIHKDNHLDTTFVMSSVCPFLIFVLLSTDLLISLDFLALILVGASIGCAVYLHGVYEEYNKELLELLEEERNG